MPTPAVRRTAAPLSKAIPFHPGRPRAEAGCDLESRHVSFSQSRFPPTCCHISSATRPIMPPPPPASGLASRLFLGPALRAQPDRRLVRLFRDGYENAFEEIVRRYDRGLRRYAAAIVPAHRA